MMQRRQKTHAIPVVDETGATVVAALDEMKGMAGKHDARGTRHAEIHAAPSLRLRHRTGAQRTHFAGAGPTPEGV